MRPQPNRRRQAPPRRVEHVLDAEPAAVPDLRHRAIDFAGSHGADETLRERIALAVSEAVTNAVKYAYDRGGWVRLKASVEDGWLAILVADGGKGFRPTESGGIGLGLTIIGEVSEDLEIKQSAGGTRVTMRFPLPRPKG